MLDAAPRWTFRSPQPLTQWYDHVYLLPDHVLGQWICLRRTTGEMLWRNTTERPNTVSGISDGVIVATEMRSGGPWTANFDLWGIDLESGRILWRWPRPAWFHRLLPFVPTDTAAVVSDTECVTTRGAVLELRTGKLLRKVSPTPWKPRETPASTLYGTGALAVEAGTLRRGLPGGPPGAQPFAAPFGLHLVARDGGVRWSFDPRAHGRDVDANYYGWRHAGTHVYLVTTAAGAPSPSDVGPALRDFELWALDLGSGEVTQRIVVGECRACRIEDVDERGVLVSCDQTLSLYERARLP